MRDKIDGHMHLSLTKHMSTLQNIYDVEEIIQKCELSAVNVLNIVMWETKNLLRNPLSLYLKFRNPQTVFSFGGIIFPNPCEENKNSDYAAQVERLMKLGFDGVKLFGKPTVRKEFGETFNSKVFYPMFEKLMAENVPVLFHMGDPEEFWSEKLVPSWARENGWYYDNTFPSNDELYEEIEALLSLFPKLNICFPHFYFLSNDLKRCINFLDKHPNVFLDITPGNELYFNLSNQPQKAIEFFEKYQNRIFLGTDNVGNSPEAIKDVSKLSKEKLQMITDFLEKKQSQGFGKQLNGLGLSEQILDKLYSKNFYKFVGRRKPKTVDAELVLEYSKEMQALLVKRGDCNLAEIEFNKLISKMNQEIGAYINENKTTF